MNQRGDVNYNLLLLLIAVLFVASVGINITAAVSMSKDTAALVTGNVSVLTLSIVTGLLGVMLRDVHHKVNSMNERLSEKADAAVAAKAEVGAELKVLTAETDNRIGRLVSEVELLRAQQRAREEATGLYMPEEKPPGE